MDARAGSLWHKRAGVSNSSEVSSTSRWTTLNQSNIIHSQREEGEVCYLLNNTVVAGLLVQPGFTEVDHHVREEDVEAGQDEEEADHDDEEPGQGRR